MASNENQPLHIALVIFVMLTIILGVTTYMFFREKEENFARAKTSDDSAKTAQAALTAIQDENNKIKRILGVSEAAKFADIETTYRDDMARLEQTTLPEGSRFYKAALEFVLTTLHERDAQLAALDTENKSLKVVNEQYKAQLDTQVAAFKAAADEAEKTAALREQEKTDAIAQKNKDEQALKDQFASERTTIEDDLKKSKDQVASVTKEKDQIAALSKAKDEVIDNMDPSIIEDDDGEIRHVNQKSRLVYINVGSADSLRKQITFSVHDVDENVVLDVKAKARIEVVNILGPHLAEARILEDDLSNPIVPGDKIFTPLWDQGRSEHFAIAGFMDLDGDDTDDRELLKSLITMAGGEIDAEMTLDGKVQGKMDLNTRYLLMGTFAEEKEIQDVWKQFDKEAEKHGVDRINIQEFLDHIGWKDPQQVVRFGKGGNISSIPPELPDGGRPEAKGAVSGAFNKRRPPRAKPGTRAADREKELEKRSGKKDGGK